MENLTLTIILKIALPVLTMIIGWLVGKYGRPWVHAKESRLDFARRLEIIADGVTADIVQMFPDVTWDDQLRKVTMEIFEALELDGTVVDDGKKAAVQRAATKALLNRQAMGFTEKSFS